ncbi:MAG TPA: hypothetical protein DDZ96_01005 [Porphyromonadaceae bacterium]|jgi:hypothetical protein|nr:hypothetical protein [Porphyromonadaceae bacterium]HBL32382.1 hypothetical protein [Porphyromonadaceae bacterium]HBX21361.1 hypothetical protein [Porphyromonadaceae bacterium]HCM19893.1 hypothetical protein [Porphyromonadaceae bacterium]
MAKNKIILRFSVITVLILLAALSRLIPHPANFAPIGGMALFGAAYYSKRYWAFIIPIVTMWISDLILNNVVYGEFFDGFVWFYDGAWFTYGAFALIVLMGTFTLKKVRIPNLLFSALGASVIFFVVSNFGVWFSGTMYPKDFGGLMACYTAGVPFFKNTVLGDLFYTAVLFGAFEVSAWRFPQLRSQDSGIS